MAIVDLQRRARELGRIRIGQVVQSANGKNRPAKLDKFRLTSSSRPLLEKVAELYGGTVQEWQPQGGGAAAWEVVTESNRLPVLVPPQPVSQYYETWSGGGCQRRCDGVTELLSDSPCPCGPNPEEKVCKPTTRLNVVLRNVEGIGVWRLESHGWYSAVELPDVADFLAQSRGYVEAHLALEERVVKRDGKTNRFMVPTLEVSVTPAQLMAGNGAQQISGPAPRELSVPAPRAIAPTANPPATEVAPVDADSVRRALEVIKETGTLADLRSLWPEAKAAGLESVALDIAAALKARTTPVEQVGKSVDELWSQIMQTVPEDWSTSRVEDDFKEVVGVDAEKASAEDMGIYIEYWARVNA